MRTCLSLLALLLFPATLSHAQQTSPPPFTPIAPSPSGDPFLVANLGQATVPLDGLWQFHLGDDPAWSSPTFDDSHWEQLTADKPWGAQTHYDYNGFAWYRRHIILSPNSIAAIPDLAIRMPMVDNAYDLYWNGQLVGQVGKLPPHPVWYWRENPQLANFALGKPIAGVLAIRIWSAPFHSFSRGEEGGLCAPPLLGTSAALAPLAEVFRYTSLRSHQYLIAVNLLYAIVAILAFLAWLRDRKERVLLWTAAYTASEVIAFFPFLYLTGPHLSFRLQFGAEGTLYCLTDIALWFLLLYLLDLNRRPGIVRATRICAWISLITSLIEGSLQFYDWSSGHTNIYLAGDITFTLIPTLLELYPLVLICFALRQRRSLAAWLVAVFALLATFFSTMPNLFGQAHRFTHWNFANKFNPELFTINGNVFDARAIASILLLLSIVYAVCRYAIDQNRRQSSLESEFKSAQELQRILIPETLPPLPGFAVTSAYRPAQEVGGDFFQLIALKSGPHSNPSSLFVLGDVSGKGLKAAMSVALIVGTIRSLADIFQRPADILAGLNRCLHGRMQHGFATCIIVRIDPDGACTFANAGHLPPFLNQRELELPSALPLGLTPSASYDETTIHLNIGDRITLYTDGLLEARNPTTHELFGFDRLRQLLSSQPNAKQATEAAVAFGQDDDITVLTITRLATGVESTTHLEAPTLVASRT